MTIQSAVARLSARSIRSDDTIHRASSRPPALLPRTVCRWPALYAIIVAFSMATRYTHCYMDLYVSYLIPCLLSSCTI